jgi:hypothetical protein
MSHLGSMGLSRRELLGSTAATGIGALVGAAGAGAVPASRSMAMAWSPGDFIEGVGEFGGDLAAILARNGLQFNAVDTTPTSLKYRGEKVVLAPYSASEYSYSATKFLELSALRGEGFTVFGDVGFIFDDGGYVRTVDLVSQSSIADFALPSGVQGASNHAGQANFGAEFVDPGDEFPVLYLSSYLEKKCYVLRMTRTGASLVQTIYLTDGSMSGSSYVLSDAQAFFVDLENDKLVIKMGATDPAGAKYKYWKVFDMPRLSLGSVVYLFEEKQNDEFYVRTLQGNVAASKNFVNAGFAMNGKIYVLAGFTGATSSLLVIDYEKHKVLTEIRWASTLITGGEQEQCARYGNALLINFNYQDYLVRVTF